MNTNETSISATSFRLPNPNNTELTIIIPTLADHQRRSSLLRAIDSINAQTDCPSHTIVVINGQQYDPSLVSELMSLADIQVIMETKASVKIARQRGLLSTITPYFAFLDDDDELLPDSNKNRLDALKKNSGCIFSISRGYRMLNGKRIPSASNIADAQKEPYEELEKNNWFTSCGAVFRNTKSVIDSFNELPDYHEWTYLAYKLVSLGNFCVVDTPCYIIHESPISLSKRYDYSVAHTVAFMKALQLNIPPAVKKSVKRRLARAEHDVATIALKNRQWRTAFTHHIRSLVLPGGLQYLPFTRHLANIRIFIKNNNDQLQNPPF